VKDMERFISEKGYTLKQLILAVRKEYIEQLKKLEELSDLVIPVSRRVDKLEFSLSSGLTSTRLRCDAIKKINKLDELLKRTDKIILSSFEYEPHKMIPYVRKDTALFDDLKDEILSSDYVKNMGIVSRFASNNDDCLLQTNAEEVIFTRKHDRNHPAQQIVYKDVDSLILSNDTTIADAYNMLNITIPNHCVNDYQKKIMDAVENPYSLRVIDARKANEIEETNGVVLIARRK